LKARKRLDFFALRNLTNDIWVLAKKDATMQAVKNGEPAPLLVGNKIEFGNSNFAEVK